jgi:signal transduction histidine kinase
VTSATGPLDPTGPPRPTGSSSWPGPGTGSTAIHPDDADRAGPGPDEPPQGHDHAHLADPPAPRHRRRPWAVVVLSVLLVLVTALSAYLWVRTVRYEEYAQDIEDQARAIGTELATLRTEHEGTVGELAAVNDQLATAQTRITELADEKAQVGDDREVQRQLVDYQQRVSQAAANVASALSTCIDAQNQLITYLENSAAYDPTDLARFKGDVQNVCAVATEANTELQRQLAAGADG